MTATKPTKKRRIKDTPSLKVDSNDPRHKGARYFGVKLEKCPTCGGQIELVTETYAIFNLCLECGDKFLYGIEFNAEC